MKNQYVVSCLKKYIYGGYVVYHTFEGKFGHGIPSAEKMTVEDDLKCVTNEKEYRYYLNSSVKMFVLNPWV